MPIVKFTKEKRELEVPKGANLRTEALKAGINLYPGLKGLAPPGNKILNCHGLGLCGTCRVNVIKGMDHTNPLTFIENMKFHVPLPDPVAALAYIGNSDKMRLACKLEVHGDIEVETCPEIDLFGENFFS